ncbi:MAG: DUF465 domain-containing protein [Alphaproteobacteria bacterium]|nr:DUF465 domain-containing protein [Alphaproteobacteria bacterium]
MDLRERDTLKRKLAELQGEHRDLDAVLSRVAAEPDADELQLLRLKKRKLLLKDQIAELKDQLLPDITA